MWSLVSYLLRHPYDYESCLPQIVQSKFKFFYKNCNIESNKFSKIHGKKGVMDNRKKKDPGFGNKFCTLIKESP